MEIYLDTLPRWTRTTDEMVNHEKMGGNVRFMYDDWESEGKGGALEMAESLDFL
jgi:hypothetical protein